MTDFIFYIFIFIISYLFYVIFVLNRKSILNKFINSKEILYLKYRYNIKIDSNNLKSVANKVFMANSFILSTTVYIISLFKSLILQALVGILTLVILILTIYHIIGIYYKKKQGGKKHV